MHVTPLLSLLPFALASQDPAPVAPVVNGPLTVAERTGWTETSTHGDVLEFLSHLEEAPFARWLRTETVGQTNEGRDLVLVTAANPMPKSDEELLASPRLRILVNANIHGGEVEGKEAVQILLRELAHGQHAELLERAVLLFVPVYNADGNDMIDPGNRSSQNGPVVGVGERANAQGLDLNRDFVKVESPECAALMGLFRRFDPHVFMDLHTTNGSHHGYHLTYSPSLSTNVDESLDRYARKRFLPTIRTAVLEGHGYRVFDYGNFSRRGPKAWSTYDHRPRFGTNYYGLRNRLAVLSEAYSYADFETRVRTTRAFVLETVRAAGADYVTIVKVCMQADLRAEEGTATFGFGTELAEGEPGDVLVGSVERIEEDGRTRLAMEAAFQTETMTVRDRFVSKTRVPLPAAWAILDPTDEVLGRLLIHGIDVERVTAEAEAAAHAFRPTEVTRGRRPFQGHEEIRLAGDWVEQDASLPVGTLIVSGRQRLARVAAQLLEPQSEDSLSTWNYFDGSTRVTEDGAPGAYAVLRLEAAAELETEAVPALK